MEVRQAAFTTAQGLLARLDPADSEPDPWDMSNKVSRGWETTNSWAPS